MSSLRGQSVPLAQVHSGDGVSGAPLPVGSSLANGSEDRPFFRLNLLRALQLHRRLALGIALAGLVLALAYVVMTWPVYTAQSQVYIQPVQSKVMAQGDDQALAQQFQLPTTPISSNKCKVPPTPTCC